MRTATATGQRPVSDLTARARLRDAAIECFAEQGFDASVRAIATRAGVSPALITHHFGSKAALREECDTEVLHRYHELKSAGIARPDASLLENLATPALPAMLAAYLLRVVLAGGTAAQTFIDRMIEDLRPVMADSVATGLIRPSRDEDARLRYLIYQSFGTMLVHFVIRPDLTPEEFFESLRTAQHGTLLPLLELYSEGLLTDHRLLDAYLEAENGSDRRRQS